MRLEKIIEKFKKREESVSSLHFHKVFQYQFETDPLIFELTLILKKTSKNDIEKILDSLFKDYKPRVVFIWEQAMIAILFCLDRCNHLYAEEYLDFFNDSTAAELMFVRQAARKILDSRKTKFSLHEFLKLKQEVEALKATVSKLKKNSSNYRRTFNVN